MRVLFLANNWLGWQAGSWLASSGEDIVGLVLHPHNKRRFGEEIAQAVNVSANAVFTGDTLRDPVVLERIAALGADIAVSVLFGHILTLEFQRLFPSGTLNLHPALLPYNRGQYPNVWSIIEGTPAGTTLHYIDSGIDTGPIIAQQEVPVEPFDTGETLYRKLERASLALFQRTWPSIVAGTAARTPQAEGAGTWHRTRDVEAVDEIDLDRSYRARDLINILRARTFPPYKGAFFRIGAKKIYLRLQLTPDD